MRRRRVLGVPVGRRKQNHLGRLAAAGASAVALVPVAQQAARAVQKTRSAARGASDVLDQLGSVKDAVSSHSSTVGKAAALVSTARHGGKNKPKLSHLIEEHTDIGVPRSVVYNQWTQMELFPTIVKGVETVDQKEDDQAVWTSKIGPVRRVWKARITEQVPDEKIAWKSESGPEHQGVVTFHSLGDDLTRVLIQIQYKPHGPLETIANELRIQRRRVRRDLRMFKHFLELRGEETGEWRGEIGSGGGRGGSGRSKGPARGRGRSTASSASRSSSEARSSSSTRGHSASRAASSSGNSSSRQSSNGKAGGSSGSTRPSSARNARGSTGSTSSRSASRSNGKGGGSTRANGAKKAASR